MDLESDALHLDRRLVSEGVPAYEELLHEDARVIVPGAVLDRAECISAIRSAEVWRSAELTLLWHRASVDGWTVIYRFDGQRDEEYSAIMSSRYLRTEEGSRLLLHQQTPAPHSVGDLR